MPIIKLTHTNTTYTEKNKKIWVLSIFDDFEYTQHWDKLPTYHDTAKCVFFSATAVVEGKEVDGSVFNGDFVKETPEEILRMIKEAENEK